MKEFYISRKKLREVKDGERVLIHSLTSKGWKTEGFLELDENVDSE